MAHQSACVDHICQALTDGLLLNIEHFIQSESLRGLGNFGAAAVDDLFDFTRVVDQDNRLLGRSAAFIATEPSLGDTIRRKISCGFPI